MAQDIGEYSAEGQGAQLRIGAFATVGAVPSATLTLSWDQRQRSRLRARCDDGRVMALMLPRGRVLRGGDLLQATDGTIVAVQAAVEEVSDASSPTGASLLRACYHLANRHVPVQFADDRLRYRRDHVLDDMLCGLGYAVAHLRAVFEPEAGAYAHGPVAAERAAEATKGPGPVQIPAGWPPLSPSSLLSLLRLASPALPVGAFAYSQGLEYAVEHGWVRDERSSAEWILGLLRRVQARQDIPVLSRLYHAWRDGDRERVWQWNARLLAMRDSAESRAEERDTGTALARLLMGLGEARTEVGAGETSYVSMYALGATIGQVPITHAACAWAWAWCQNQVAAAIKLVPLGQTAGQRMLVELSAAIPGVVTQGLAIEDEDIGFTAPGLALASALHEGQYTRLFLS